MLIGCIYSPEKSDTISCLLKIGPIARVQTFREATFTAGICATQFEKDTKLNLRLAELYLLSYLVDNDEKGLAKATDQFSKTLKIDTSFTTNYKDFNLNEKDFQS